MGKNAFAYIQGEGARLQLMFNRDLTKVSGYTPDDGPSPFKLLEKKLDLGDIVGASGHLFHLPDNKVWLTDHVPPGFIELPQ